MRKSKKRKQHNISETGDLLRQNDRHEGWIQKGRRVSNEKCRSGEPLDFLQIIKFISGFALGIFIKLD